MVTGQKAFEGDSKMSTLAAILNKNPSPLVEIGSRYSSRFGEDHQPLPAERSGTAFQHMDDLKVELEELKEESDSGTLAGDTTLRFGRLGGLGLGGSRARCRGDSRRRWFFRGTARKPAAAPEVVPLTSYAGSERSPSFSPDGNQVAFSWNGEKQDNSDIYVKLIGSPTPERLTTDPAEDISPAFSPDGRSIGFVRVSKERATFIVIPAIGGPERIVAEVPAPLTASVVGPSFAWLPDGKWVVTDGLALLSTESGETRSLTSPPTKSTSDFSPAVSPDGRTVAFSRSDRFPCLGHLLA